MRGQRFCNIEPGTKPGGRSLGPNPQGSDRHPDLAERRLVGEVTRRQAEQHDDDLAFRYLDTIAVKGKEDMSTYLLLARKADSPTPTLSP